MERAVYRKDSEKLNEKGSWTKTYKSSPSFASGNYNKTSFGSNNSFGGNNGSTGFSSSSSCCSDSSGYSSWDIRQNTTVVTLGRDQGHMNVAIRYSDSLRRVQSSETSKL